MTCAIPLERVNRRCQAEEFRFARRGSYAEYPEVLKHLSDMELDLIENASSSPRNEPAALIVPGP